MIDYYEEWLIAVEYIASIGKHEEFSEVRNVKHIAQLERIKAQLDHNHIDRSIMFNKKMDDILGREEE